MAIQIKDMNTIQNTPHPTWTNYLGHWEGHALRQLYPQAHLQDNNKPINTYTRTPKHLQEKMRQIREIDKELLTIETTNKKIRNKISEKHKTEAPSQTNRTTIIRDTGIQPD